MSQVNRTEGLVGNTGIKAPCRVATTASLGANYAGLPVLDGVQTASGDRILRKDEATTTLNGIWVADTGVWIRAQDFDGVYDAATGTLVKVNSGAAGAGIYELATADPVTVGTSAIVWSIVTTPLVTTINLVNTIATLKALGAGAYASVLVLGYAAAGDGGWGIFWWNSTDATVDNGGTVIQPNSAPAMGRWNRL